MPTRMVRDGILSSERIALLNWAEEVFYRRLMSVVDDYGRFSAHFSLIRAACYPLKLEKVSDSDVGKWLLATEKAGLVRVYPATDGKRYLEIQDFGQRVQSKSKYPAPIEGSRESAVIHGDSPESTALVGVGVGVGVGDGPPPDKPALADGPAFIEIPLNDGSGFPVTEAQVDEFSGLYPAVDVRQELRAMRAWGIANPSKRKTRGGAMRFVNSWLGKEQDKGGSRSSANGGGASRKRVDL